MTGVASLYFKLQYSYSQLSMLNAVIKGSTAGKGNESPFSIEFFFRVSKIAPHSCIANSIDKL